MSRVFLRVLAMLLAFPVALGAGCLSNWMDDMTYTELRGERVHHREAVIALGQEREEDLVRCAEALERVKPWWSSTIGVTRNDSELRLEGLQWDALSSEEWELICALLMETDIRSIFYVQYGEAKYVEFDTRYSGGIVSWAVDYGLLYYLDGAPDLEGYRPLGDGWFWCERWEREGGDNAFYYQEIGENLYYQYEAW